MAGFNGTNCEHSKHKTKACFFCLLKYRKLFDFSPEWLRVCMFILIDIDECEVQPCQNNGTCIDLINNYQCYCTDGFNGKNCTISKLKILRWVGG